MRISVPFDGARPILPDVERLVGASWSFGSGGDVYAPFMRFRQDGRIGGHHHPDETGWKLRHGALVLLDERGVVSLVFDRATRADGGRLTLFGRKTIREQRSYELVEIVAAHDGVRPHRPVRVRRRRPATPRRDLVIVRADESSLHPAWTADIDDRDRSWDLCTSFYGAAAHFPPDDVAEYAVLQREERKFQALRSLLLSNPALTDYDYFMFPDDDLAMRWSDINACFQAMRRWRLQLAQPSLHPDGVVNYPSTRQDGRYHVRFVSMVEVMTPLMSRETLLACLPTFDLTRSSFGIDYAWSKIIGGDPTAIGIIDDVAVLHTRPTATNYDIGAAYKEGDALSARYGRTEWFQVNVRGGIHRGW